MLDVFLLHYLRYIAHGARVTIHPKDRMQLFFSHPVLGNNGIPSYITWRKSKRNFFYLAVRRRQQQFP